MSLPPYLVEASNQFNREKLQRVQAGGRTYTDVLAALKIITRQQQIVPLELYPIQRDLLSKLTGRDLILKPRQVGISTFVRAHLFATAVSRTARMAVLAHDAETTQKLRDMDTLFYDELPAALKPVRTTHSATRTHYADTRSTVYIGTAGNTSGGLGGTYSHVHGSEVSRWKNAEHMLAGLMQGVPLDGTIILESTPAGAQGWYFEQVMAALRGESEFTVHFYEWWWDETYALPTEKAVLDYSDDEARLVERHGLTPGQILWRRKKQREIGRLFPQEYPEDPVACFLSSGDNVFGDFRSNLYTPAKARGPIAGHVYIAGLDWGVENDYSCLSIMDATANREVVLKRWRHMPWADIRRAVLRLCERWRVERLRPERNSASSNIEDLDAELYARWMVQEAAGIPVEQRHAMSLEPFTMTNKLKGDMVGELVKGIHEDGLKLLNPISDGVAWATAEMQQFMTQQTSTGLWTYSHPESGHDDSIIARMAAWWGCVNRMPESW